MNFTINIQYLHQFTAWATTAGTVIAVAFLAVRGLQRAAKNLPKFIALGLQEVTREAKISDIPDLKRLWIDLPYTNTESEQWIQASTITSTEYELGGGIIIKVTQSSPRDGCGGVGIYKETGCRMITNKLLE